MTLIFLTFYLTARENRVFKNWRRENILLFISYIDIKSRFQLKASPGDKLLINGAVLQNIKAPFPENLLGNIRKPLFFLLSPRLKNYSIFLKAEEFHFHVEKLNSMKGVDVYKKISLSLLESLNADNFKAIKKFMLENEIGYFVFPYEDWWGIKDKLKEAGLKKIVGNKHFIISEIM